MIDPYSRINKLEQSYISIIYVIEKVKYNPSCSTKQKKHIDV